MASDFKAYAERFHAWVLQQIEATGSVRQLHSAFAVLADKLGEEPLSMQTFYDWRDGKLKRELNQRSLRLIAARRDWTETEVSTWLAEGEEPRGAEAMLPKLTVLETIAAYSRQELIQVLQTVSTRLAALERDADSTAGAKGVREFGSIAELLLDAFSMAGLSREQGLAQLKRLYLDELPNATDAAKFDGYLHGTVNFDTTDQSECYTLAVLLRSLTGANYSVQDVETLRCPACDTHRGQAGHHVQAQ